MDQHIEKRRPWQGVTTAAGGSDSAGRDSAGRDSAGQDRWLARLWPLAILFHLVGNGHHLLVLDLIGICQLAVVAFAAATIVRPTALQNGALAASYLLVLWLKLPKVGNHEIILGLLALAILGTVLTDRESWTTAVAPLGRWILLLAYGFIALSKLNRGFFDVATSCAVLFADDLGTTFGLPAVRSLPAGSAVIAATAAIEIAIPVLLLRTRFRLHGVVLALTFHFVLAADPRSHIWDFSATLLPLFLLFSPVRFRCELDRRLAAFDHKTVFERALAVLMVIAGHSIIGFSGGLWLIPDWSVAYVAWLSVSGGLLVAAWRFLRRNPTETLEGPILRPAADASRLLRFWLGGIVLLTLSNGVAPYLEVRSAAAFNMYSNLRIVDGESNHFFVGSIRSASNTSDYVEVQSAAADSPLAFYAGSGLIVPKENLDRYLRENPQEDPLVRSDDQTGFARSLGHGQPSSDGFAASISEVIQRKLRFRRAVNATENGACLRSWGPIG